MRRFILKRLWQMVPTVAGVLLVTFILFNVAGGSPALMILGKNATARDIETFDEQNGYNRPLIAGNWLSTRAFAAFEARSGAAAPAGIGDGPVPLAFELKPETLYRWTISAAGAGRLVVASGSNTLAEIALDAAKARRVRCEFRTPAAGKVESRLLPGSAGLQVRAMKLERANARWWDSQLVFFLRQLARGDFGMSLATNRSVATMLKEGVGPSLLLTVPIFFAGLALSVALALVCAYFRNTWLDRSLVVVAVALMSINYLVWIIAGQYMFAYRWGWFPVWGFESWRYLLLPIAIGVLSSLGSNLRFYRTVMLDELQRDYVRTAFSKGLGVRRVLFVHVLKNAMIPIITNTVIAIPFLYTGSLLLESFFGIPGLGGLSINAINAADFNVVRAVVLIGAILYVFANLLSDLCYALVDPRVKLE